MAEKTKVLFMCTGNSCRSQMAEGWLRHLAGERFEALSAGLEPSRVNPVAITVMKEVGIDISAQRSKHVREYLGLKLVGYVIFVCSSAEKNCPALYPFAYKRLAWPFEDPAAFEGSPEARMAKFREVRDQIGARIKSWLDEVK